MIAVFFPIIPQNPSVPFRLSVVVKKSHILAIAHNSCNMRKAKQTLFLSREVLSASNDRYS